MEDESDDDLDHPDIRHPAPQHRQYLGKYKSHFHQLSIIFYHSETLIYYFFYDFLSYQGSVTFFLNSRLESGKYLFMIVLSPSLYVTNSK